YFFFQAEDGIRDKLVTGVQTCALPILNWAGREIMCLRSFPAACTQKDITERENHEHNHRTQGISSCGGGDKRGTGACEAPARRAGKIRTGVYEILGL